MLTWRIWWASNNASRWQMGFNSAFKGLNVNIFSSFYVTVYTRVHHSEMEPVHNVTPYVFKMYSNINLFENIRSDILLMKTIAIDALMCCRWCIQGTCLCTAGENVCGLKALNMPGTNTPMSYSDMCSFKSPGNQHFSENVLP